MDTRVDFAAGIRPPCEIVAPEVQTVPLVFASPHSGTDYPPDFIALSRLDPLTLRRSEDSFVDELFAAAPTRGAPLLSARFPRAYIDPNREAFELDPAMFEDELPDYVNTSSPRVAAGLGTVARVVASGAEIYRDKLRFGDALARVDRLYRPYHAALEHLIAATRARFGYCLLVDCHSMPSVGGPMDRDPGSRRVDFVLGDAYGAACAPQVANAAQEYLESLGYVVTRNAPYAGGFTTRNYGRPNHSVHALQIEINRALYMHERDFERGPYFATLAAHMSGLMDVLAGVEPGAIAA
jgi:N-formylglutamate amidohydrolase